MADSCHRQATHKRIIISKVAGGNVMSGIDKTGSVVGSVLASQAKEYKVTPPSEVKLPEL